MSSYNKKKIGFVVFVIIIVIVVVAVISTSKSDVGTSPPPSPPGDEGDEGDEGDSSMDSSQIFSSPLSTELNPNDVQIIEEGRTSYTFDWNPTTQIEVDDNGCVFVAYRQFGEPPPRGGGFVPGLVLAFLSNEDPPSAVARTSEDVWKFFPLDQEMVVNLGQSLFPGALALSRGGSRGSCATATVAYAPAARDRVGVATLTSDATWNVSEVTNTSPSSPGFNGSVYFVALEASTAGLYLCLPSSGDTVLLLFLPAGDSQWTVVAEIDPSPSLSTRNVALAVVDDAIFVSLLNSAELYLYQVDTGGDEHQLLLRQPGQTDVTASPLLAADLNGVVVGAVFVEEESSSRIRLWEIGYGGQPVFSYPSILARATPLGAALSITSGEVIVSAIRSAEKKTVEGSLQRWEAPVSFGFLFATSERPSGDSKSLEWSLTPVNVPGPHGSIASAVAFPWVFISLMETGKEHSELKIVKVDLRA